MATAVAVELIEMLSTRIYQRGVLCGIIVMLLAVVAFVGTPRVMAAWSARKGK